MRIGPGRVNLTGESPESMYDETQAIIADYLLRYRGIPLAILEAKGDSESAEDGMQQASRYARRLLMRFSIANPLMDCFLLLGLGAGGGYLLKRKSPEQIAAREKENIRQHELEVAEVEAAKVKAADDATVAMMGQKHDSYRKAAEGLG